MPRSFQSSRRGWIILPLYRRSPRGRAPSFLTSNRNPQHNPKYENVSPKGDRSERTKFARSVMEGSTVALISLLGLGLGGYAYSQFYKKMVLDKIENAFSTGYSSNELVAMGRIAYGTSPDLVQEIAEKEYWVPRKEQPMVDDIVSGKLRGRYYLIIGERGTGKRSLLLEAMRKVGGDGCAMLEAHHDLEVFRVRLGKAIDYEFHEDYIGSLFSIKGPRDSTPLLDIERALNKMEKVALKMRKNRQKPLVLIINNIHLFNDDAASRSLLELLQQRAEIWSSNDLVTTIFTSDENWTYARLIPLATNMPVINIRDVSKDTAISALKNYRARFRNEDVPSHILEEIFAKVGGRLIFLNRVAKSDDMLATCDLINRKEKAWLLNQCWILGESMDDDVEAQQKYCAAAMVLARALVLREKQGDFTDNKLPEIPLHEARQIITRADFTQDLDHINVIHIDSDGMVRADSVPMQNAFKAICSEDGFEEHLKATLKRLDELEFLNRSRLIVERPPPNYSDGEVPVQTYTAKL